MKLKLDRDFPWVELFMVLALIILFLGVSKKAHSATVQLAWDHNPPEDLVQAYILYEKFVTVPPPFWESPPPVTNYIKRHFVSGDTNGMVLTNVYAGPHTYVLTASNFWGESVFSNEAFTTVDKTNGVPPGAPGGIQMRVIDLETAAVNLQTFPITTPGGEAYVDHSFDATDWSPLLLVRGLSTVNTLSNMSFTIAADKPREFYRFRVLQP